FRSDDRAAPHEHVAGHAGLTGENNGIFQFAAAGDSRLGRQQGIAANLHAVGDLNAITDLGAAPDARLTNGRPVVGRVRPDFNVVFDHDAADLRNLLMRSVGSLGET